METARLTVIIPTFRRPGYLKKALQSVLDQDYTDFEVRVFDNASGDETSSVVAGFAQNDPRVQYHCHAANIGARANFLFGLRQVKTPFFCFLSDDDLMLQGFLAEAMQGFATHSLALFSGLQTLNIDENDRVWGIMGKTWPAGYYAGDSGIRAFCEHGHLIWTGVVFAADAKEDFAALMEKYEVVSDLAIEFSLALRGPFVVAARPGAAFRTHSSSYSQMSFNLVADQTAEMIDAVIHQTRFDVFRKAEIAKAVKNRLYPIVMGMWHQFIIANTEPGPALTYLAWVRDWRRKALMSIDRKMFVIGSIVRIASLTPISYRVLRRACALRYGKPPQGGVAEELEKLQLLLKP